MYRRLGFIRTIFCAGILKRASPMVTSSLERGEPGERSRLSSEEEADSPNSRDRNSEAN